LLTLDVSTSMGMDNFESPLPTLQGTPVCPGTPGHL